MVVEKAKLDLTSSTAVVKEWNGAAAEATVTTTGSTIEITGAGGNFVGGGLSYATTKIITREGKLSGSNTHTTLEFLNEGVAAKGIEVSQTTTQTFTNLNFKGKAGELARVESSKAATAWKLKHTGDYEPVNSFVAVKDCTYEGGTLYLPNGKDEGGNTNIKFEAKPSGAIAFSATATIGAKPTAATAMFAATAATAGIGTRTTSAEKMSAATAAKAALSLSPKLTDQLLAAFNATATTSISANLSNKLAAAFQAHTGVTIQPNAHFRLVTTETGKKVLILILDE
jgi:hypothetical protein